MTTGAGVSGADSDSTAPAAPPAPAAPGRPKEPHVPGPLGPRWSRWLGQFLARVVWATTVVGAEHVPADGPVLLASNHTGLIDGPILLGVAPRPLHVLVKTEMFRGPVGWILRAAGQIPVDRSSSRGALAVALAVLRRGGGIGMFPEGNRGRGDVASARAGVAWLALNGGAPVVPVAMVGTRRTGESVGHIPGLRRRIVVAMGPAVHVSRAPGTSGRAALDAANAQIQAALTELVAATVARTGVTLPTDDPNRAA
ncbi:lysophospholipid acyltransferase family protein [Cellulomonas hominis]